MEKKKNTLTVTLYSHKRTTESLRMWGQASLLPGYLLTHGSGPVPSLPCSLLIWNTGPQHHFTHQITGEMLTQAQRLAWVDRLERKELYHDASKGLIGAKNPPFLPMHFYKACMHAQSLSCIQLFVTPWTVACHEILQARILQWIAIPFSRGSF